MIGEKKMSELLDFILGILRIILIAILIRLVSVKISELIVNKLEEIRLEKRK